MKTTSREFFVLRHRNGRYLEAVFGTIGGEDGFGDIRVTLEARGHDASAAWRAESAKEAMIALMCPPGKYDTRADRPGHAYAAEDVSVEKVTVLVDCQKTDVTAPGPEDFRQRCGAVGLGTGARGRYSLRDLERLEAREQEVREMAMREAATPIDASEWIAARAKDPMYRRANDPGEWTNGMAPDGATGQVRKHG